MKPTEARWSSRPFFQGIEGSRRRSIYRACGYGDADLDRPHIGIVNAFSEAAPGHVHLRPIPYGGTVCGLPRASMPQLSVAV